MISAHPWVLLGVAILPEVASTTFLKPSRGFEHPGYVAGMFTIWALSLIVQGLAVKRIEIGSSVCRLGGSG